MSEHPMPDLESALERMSLIAKACRLSGFDHLPVVSRANAQPFAADLDALISEAREAGRLREYAAKIRALEKDLYRSSLLAGPPKYYERGPQHKAWVEGRYSTAKALRELRQNYQALSPPTPDAGGE